MSIQFVLKLYAYHLPSLGEGQQGKVSEDGEVIVAAESKGSDRELASLTNMIYMDAHLTCVKTPVGIDEPIETISNSWFHSLTHHQALTHALTHALLTGRVHPTGVPSHTEEFFLSMYLEEN